MYGVGSRWFRVWQYVRFNMWLVPTIYLGLALAGGILLPWLDRRAGWHGALHPSLDSVRDALSAVGTGMITFTGLVFSLLLLLIQFGSTAFSPRLVRRFRRDRMVKHALGAFIATFVFSLTAVMAVGQGGTSFPPTVSFAAAWLLLVGSLVLFILLIGRVMDGLRVAQVTRTLAADVRTVLARAHPDPLPDHPEPAPDPHGELVQTVRHTGIGGIVLTLDRGGLARLARRAGGTVVVTRAIGEFVADGDVLAEVYGQRPVSEQAIQAAIVTGDERLLDDDPAFGLRVLVDIALRALSPAVNDPTTAVQALDAISSVLRFAAPRRLTGGVVDDPGATPRLIYRTASWDDLVALAITEIRESAGSSSQVRARLHRLLTDLAIAVPPARRPAVDHQLSLLEPAESGSGDRPYQPPANPPH